MKIYLTNQENNFQKHLDDLKRIPVMFYDRSHLKEKTSSIDIETKTSLADLDLNFFFSYNIFPKHILIGFSEWELEGRQMKAGDTIVQQVYLPPNSIFSQKIIFGVRIKDVVNTPMKKGFSYETLEGHAEKGLSTFMLEQSENKIIFTIQTISGAGNFLSKIAGPFFTFPYQAFCTRAALKNVKEQINKQVKP